jgi:phosphate transport system permease protein
MDEVRQTLVWKDDWPVFQTETIRQAGMRTHLLGTGLLMVLTSLIALPFGVGAGVYLAHYGESQAARLCRLAITTLRAMSVIILGMLGFSVVRLASGTPLQDVLCGYYYSVSGTKHGTSGSYLLASLILSLLVIPVIARATEEGCRSLPAVLREGSLALGASEAYTLWRVTLPWAFPNIITALLLGCAEAAGSVAAIVLMAGTGAAGVGLFQGVTSLAFLVFRSRYSAGIYREMMGDYTYAAAFLVLLICIGLSTAALLLRRRFGERYRQR